MFFDFSEFFITADDPAAKKAAELFIDEIKSRADGKLPDGKKNEIRFEKLQQDLPAAESLPSVSHSEVSFESFAAHPVSSSYQNSPLVY